MADVTVRYQVKDDGEFKRTFGQNKKEADVLIDRIKAAGKAVSTGLVLTLKDARTLLQSVGGDTRRFEAALKKAGVPINEARVMTAALRKELNESAKEAYGLNKNAKGAAGSIKEGDNAAKGLVKSIKEGTFAAHALEAVFERSRRILEDIKELGNVKGTKDATKDAQQLNDQYDQLQRKLSMTKDPQKFAEVRKNIEDTSIRHNIPQEKLIEAVDIAQETKSAGRALAFDNRGALLDQIAQNLYSTDVKKEDIAESVKGQVVMMQNFGFTSDKDIAEMHAIMRSQEEVGSLSAKQLGLKSGGVMAQWAGSRKIDRFQALRETGAVAQVIADDPSVSGSIEQTNVVMENLIAKLNDQNTLDRIKEQMGVSVRDAKGYMRDPTKWLAEMAVSQRGGKMLLPQSDADLQAAENDPAKASEYKAFFEAFHDKEARRGILALVRGRQKLAQVRDVNSQMGRELLEDSYTHRVTSYSGQLDARERRDELTHGRDYKNKAPTIVAVANVTGDFGAKHPVLQELLGAGSDWLGSKSPTLKSMADSAIASGVMLMYDTKAQPRDQIMKDDASRAQAELEKRRLLLLADQHKLEGMKGEALLKNPANMSIIVKVETGMTATVTTEATTTAQKAKSGKREVKKAGQH